jgi:ubiquitin-associated SH3 domain-containing protein
MVFGKVIFIKVNDLHMIFQSFISDWMTPPELVAAGYNVELGYKPYIPADELIDLQEQVPPESIDSYYTRNFFVTQCVLQKTEEIGGNLLFVGHAATLDACSRQLVDKEQVGLQS